MSVGDNIFVDDGLISLQAEKINGDSVDCVVVNSALIVPWAGAMIPMSAAADLSFTFLL